MLTSWHWLLLTDFASYKPALLPEVPLTVLSRVNWEQPVIHGSRPIALTHTSFRFYLACIFAVDRPVWLRMR
jgi:hypothetical protein